ncbi:MAG: hypothetical protein IPJ06_12385 [Saprospiraceae bacterium]|nr:hypothetical protein [Saprospiraceae bacterium]
MNELQALSYDPVTQILTLENGGIVDLSALANVAEVDPKVNMTSINRNARWDGSKLVDGTISMINTTASGLYSSAFGRGTTAWLQFCRHRCICHSQWQGINCHWKLYNS